MVRRDENREIINKEKQVKLQEKMDAFAEKERNTMEMLTKLAESRKY